MRQENAQLRAQIAWLKKQLFGRGQGEKTGPGAVAAAAGGAGEADGAQAGAATVVTLRARPAPNPARCPSSSLPNCRSRRPSRSSPRRCRRSPELYEKVGEERTFEVDVTPPKLFKREIVRPKFRHRRPQPGRLTLAPAPPRPVSGRLCLGGTARVDRCSAKYVHHLPLYRQEQIVGAVGRHASAARRCADWVEARRGWLQLIYRPMYQGLLAGGYLQADETPVAAMIPDEKRQGPPHKAGCGSSAARAATWSSIGACRAAMGN